MNTPPKSFSFVVDTMGLRMSVWICTPPFVGFMIARLFGVLTAAIMAVALLMVMLDICWGSCIPIVVGHYRR